MALNPKLPLLLPEELSPTQVSRERLGYQLPKFGMYVWRFKEVSTHTGLFKICMPTHSLQKRPGNVTGTAMHYNKST